LHRTEEIQKGKGETLVYLFDPRYGTLVETDNPAIILADMMVRSGLIKPDTDFWNKIRRLAEEMEKPISNETKEKNLV
jgi:hypothetical protein